MTQFDELLSPEREVLDLLEAVVSLRRDELGSASSALERLTRNPDSDVRLQAHRRLLVHLKSTAHHDIACHSLVADSESEVRRVAAFGVAATASRVTRETAERLLARVVANQDEETEVRGAAYEALVLMAFRPGLPPLTRDVDLQRDVDWTWVMALAKTVLR
jgi:HEAT repeat protein